MEMVVMIGHGWRKGKMVEIGLVDIGDGHQLEKSAAEAFLRMREAALRAGVWLKVNSAFRSHKKQTELHRKMREARQAGKPHPIVARPGWSNHQSGIAVDIATMGEHSDAYEWLSARARDFGFKRTVESERWHWEHRPEEVLS